LYVPTSGYVWKSPPLSIEAEAKAIRWLFQEHFKLPFDIFVDETPTMKRADGRLMRDEPPNRNRAIGQQHLYIVDKNQRLYLFWDSPSEARIRAYVQKALTEDTAVAASDPTN